DASADHAEMVLGSILFLTGRVALSLERFRVPLCLSDAALCLSGAVARLPPLPEHAGAAEKEDEHERSQQPRQSGLSAAPDKNPLARPHWTGPDGHAAGKAPQI